MKVKNKLNIKEKLKLNNNLKKIKINASVLAIIILILILVCSYVLFFEINNYRKIRQEKYDFYYYFIADKVDFEGTLSINGKDTIVDLKSIEVEINSTPVYYKDYSGNMILPANMEIVHPYKKTPMKKLGAYSKIYYKNGLLYINFEGGKGRIYDCFLFNGENLYVFIETTTIIVGEDKFVLSPLSFVEVKSDFVRIYNAQTDEFTLIENPSVKVTGYTAEYIIDLSSDTFSYNNSYYMLIKNIDVLDLYEI